jgi:Mn2+/Fe2+ NRAMP family transporter
MKKIIVLFAFISSVFYVKAQFSTGLSGEFLYPLSKLKKGLILVMALLGCWLHFQKQYYCFFRI